MRHVTSRSQGLSQRKILGTRLEYWLCRASKYSQFYNRAFLSVAHSHLQIVVWHVLCLLQRTSVVKHVFEESVFQCWKRNKMSQSRYDTNSFTYFKCYMINMKSPCEVTINQYTQIFHIILLLQ